MSIISKCVFFWGGCGVYMFFEIFLNEDQCLGRIPLSTESLLGFPSEVSADGRLLEGAKTLCNAALRDGDAITVVAQGVSWLQTNHLRFVGS